MSELVGKIGDYTVDQINKQLESLGVDPKSVQRKDARGRSMNGRPVKADRWRRLQKELALRKRQSHVSTSSSTLSRAAEKRNIKQERKLRRRRHSGRRGQLPPGEIPPPRTEIDLADDLAGDDTEVKTEAEAEDETGTNDGTAPPCRRPSSKIDYAKTVTLGSVFDPVASTTIFVEAAVKTGGLSSADAKKMLDNETKVAKGSWDTIKNSKVTLLHASLVKSIVDSMATHVNTHGFTDKAPLKPAAVRKPKVGGAKAKAKGTVPKKDPEIIGVDATMQEADDPRLTPDTLAVMRTKEFIATSDDPFLKTILCNALTVATLTGRGVVSVARTAMRAATDPITGAVGAAKDAVVYGATCLAESAAVGVENVKGIRSLDDLYDTAKAGAKYVASVGVSIGRFITNNAMFMFFISAVVSVLLKRMCLKITEMLFGATYKYSRFPNIRQIISDIGQHKSLVTVAIWSVVKTADIPSMFLKVYEAYNIGSAFLGILEYTGPIANWVKWAVYTMGLIAQEVLDKSIQLFLVSQTVVQLEEIYKILTIGCAGDLEKWTSDTSKFSKEEQDIIDAGGDVEQYRRDRELLKSMSAEDRQRFEQEERDAAKRDEERARIAEEEAREHMERDEIIAMGVPLGRV